MFSNKLWKKKKKTSLSLDQIIQTSKEQNNIKESEMNQT